MVRNFLKKSMNYKTITRKGGVLHANHKVSKSKTKKR